MNNGKFLKFGTMDDSTYQSLSQLINRNYPDAKIDRIFTSPGPVYEPHLSESDPLWARAYFAAGIRKGDIVLNAFSYHMVAAGLTFHNGDLYLAGRKQSSLRKISGLFLR